MATALPLRVRSAAIALTVAFGALIWSASAQAIGLDNLVAEPADTQAGANSDLHVHMDLTSASDDLQDMTLMLPPGLAGNPQVPAKCPIADFNADTCVPASQVGTTTVNITALGLLPLPVSGSVYNLVPGAEEPARLGIVLRPAGDLLPLGKIFTQVEVQLRPDDLGLNSIIVDLPNTASGLIPIDINSVDLVLDESFASNPTSCDEAVTTFVVTSYAAPTTDVVGQASFTPTGCDALAFGPQVSMLVDAGQRFDPVEHPTVVTKVLAPAGQANVEAVQLTLPVGVSPNAPVLLAPPCSQAAFAARTCPASTKVGTAEAESPLLAAPLSGEVFVVKGAGLFPDVGIDLQGTLDVQLKALANVVPPNNRVQSTLSGLPDLPLTEFTLTFAGGDNGLFGAQPSVCSASARLDAVFDSHAGGQVVRSVRPTVKGCGSSGSASKKARCGGRRATRVGTPGRDVLRGTARADVIVGLGGNDVIRGRGGKDILCGRKGRDRLIGGGGRDRLFGGAGRDSLVGGPGRDRLRGGRARDLERQ